MKPILLLAVSIFVVSVHAQAATVSLYGYITPKTVKAVAERVQRELWKGDRHLTINLESEGGEVPSAVLLAQFLKEIKRSGIRVTTHARSYCESACTIIYAAGDVRTARPDTTFYFHSLGVKNAGKKKNEVQKHWALIWANQIRAVDSDLAEELEEDGTLVGKYEERTVTASQLYNNGYSYVSYLR